MRISRFAFLRRGAALAAACLFGALPAYAAPDVIRIGIATAGGGDPVTWGGSPGGVAQNQRLLEDEFKGSGTRIEWVFFKGAGPAVNEALSNKQIDFAYQGDLPSLVGRANGLNTRLLLASGTRNNLYVVVPPKSGIHEIKDLKDRRVAIFRGTNGHLVAINVLAANGLAERDIKGVHLDTGSAQAALVSDGVDAAFGGYEWFKVRDQGLVRVVYSTQGKDPSLTRQAALVVRGDFEQANPAEVQRVVDAFVRAARWASDENNRAALFEIWAKSGTPVASWQAEFDGQSLAARNSPLLDAFVLGRYKAVVEDALKLKLIRRSVTVDDWFEPRYLRAALKKQGLENYWTAYDVAGKPVVANASVASSAR
ncbi:ABC transporter substrate-binding protein [Variovorax sp. Sphag1AA]|uniref:ABC transporter substrate-binding protein n=1 Tax=Variovorax sp. Sphag1AA TaxID=2587027 RepID=UPI00160F2A9D|nr:ABC transporter substrate-binding protein [Variovorax sp. Sphag1AA]MBB3181490.1 sulfonate transport system substrate-binding protein [Variovorax sp. Sphag1AA]